MIAIRKADERGRFDFGWLDTRHTFSFGDYYDPEQMGFRALRVINEDRVRPGAGFPMHGHRDMEILTYVLSGELAHRDSLGHGETLGPGEVQRMTAGTGIRHSEFNPSDDEPVHLLQIWIEPDRRGHEPSYEQRPLPSRGGLVHAAGPEGSGAAVAIRQDAHLYAGRLGAGDRVEHRLGDGRHAWVQVARGSVRLNDRPLAEGDGAAVSGVADLAIVADRDAEFLLFDLA